MRFRQAAGLLVLLFVFASCNVYGQQVATWTDSNGNYSNGANWSTGTAPNNGGGTTYNVVINGTGADTITFDASGTVINSLSLGTGETFQDNGSSPILTTGSFTNNGSINFGAGSDFVDGVTSPSFCTTASERVYITTSSGKGANGGSQGAVGDRRAAICGAKVTGAGGL